MHDVIEKYGQRGGVFQGARFVHGITQLPTHMHVITQLPTRVDSVALVGGANVVLVQ